MYQLVKPTLNWSSFVILTLLPSTILSDSFRLPILDLSDFPFLGRPLSHPHHRSHRNLPLSFLLCSTVIWKRNYFLFPERKPSFTNFWAQSFREHSSNAFLCWWYIYNGKRHDVAKTNVCSDFLDKEKALASVGLGIWTCNRAHLKCSHIHCSTQWAYSEYLWMPVATYVYGEIPFPHKITECYVFFVSHF